MGLASDFPKLNLDPNAEAISELLKEWPKGRCALERFAKEQVDAGRWEQVLKRVGGRIVKAYRRKKK